MAEHGTYRSIAVSASAAMHSYGADREPRVVMLTVINRLQTPRLREVVSAVDPEALVVLSLSHDVLGEGFAPLTRPSLQRQRALHDSGCHLDKAFNY